jgi:hypothetical protein
VLQHACRARFAIIAGLCRWATTASDAEVVAAARFRDVPTT